MANLPRLSVLLAALVLAAPLGAQDPALKDTFLQAKAAWATQGDREAATAKLGIVLAALEPGAQQLDPAWTSCCAKPTTGWPSWTTAPRPSGTGRQASGSRPEPQPRFRDRP